MKLLFKIDLLRLGRGGIAALGLFALAFPLALRFNTYAITSCMSLYSFYWTWFVMRTDKESGFERWLLTLPGVTRRSLAYSRYLPAVLFAAALALLYTAAAAVFAPEEFLPISRSAVMGAALSVIYVSVAVPILNWRRDRKRDGLLLLAFCGSGAATVSVATSLRPTLWSPYHFDGSGLAALCLAALVFGVSITMTAGDYERMDI